MMDVTEDYQKVLSKFTWLKDLFENLKLPSRNQVKDANGKQYSGFYPYNLRHMYVDYFGYSMISEEVLNDLKTYINGRKCLEVCAGTGWLSKLLSDTCINIIATDNDTWASNDKFSNWKSNKFFDVKIIDALDAIDKYLDTEIVILSWPVRGISLANNVLNKCLEYHKELIYIGETYGGCTADYDFFDTIVEKQLKINMISPNYIPLWGAHDNIFSITE
ncbi:MAG: hypothetical protein NC548_15970 [Lachnospiraceae bacterium]|nr:hypothetical protein [Lachnospiraceae bacterium]